MQNFVLVDENNNQLDSCYAESLKVANQYFINEGWMIGDVISLSEFHNRQLDEE